jgi:hypothetical protein
MKILVKDLHSNPFRDVTRYPINADKVAALKASMQETGFWDNIVARPAPNGKGYEAAYGHHRISVLHDLKIKEIDIPIRELSDETMLRMMANENMEEWGASAAVVQETVRAVVLAYAAGRIALGSCARDTNKNKLRYAPSFVQGGPAAAAAERPYTAATVADFLKWGERKVRNFLQLLEMEESELLDSKAVNGLSVSAVHEMNNALAPYKADPKASKAVATGLAKSFREGDLGTSSGGRDRVRAQALELAVDAGFKLTRDAKKERHDKLFTPNQNEIAKTLGISARDFEAPLMGKIEKLAEHAEHIGINGRRALHTGCKEQAAKWTALAKQFGKGL